MRGAKAKAIRRAAGILARRTRTDVDQGPGPWRYLTGYRRIYRDLKATYAVTAGARGRA